MLLIQPLPVPLVLISVYVERYYGNHLANMRCDKYEGRVRESQRLATCETTKNWFFVNCTKIKAIFNLNYRFNLRG